MGLSGTLHTFPLGELLQWLGSSRKTGTLAVRGELYTKRLYFHEGVIISSASEDPTEQLGQFLLSHGIITEDDLRRGLDTQSHTRVLLGRILMMVGLIDEPRLRQMLVMKAEETIFSLFLWEDGHFDFVDDALPQETHIKIDLEVQDVLLKGLTMVDELRHIRETLGSTATILAPTGKSPGGASPAQSLPARILALVDSERTITDICLAVHASEYNVGRQLLLLLEKGYVRIARRLEAGPIDGIDRFHLAPDELLARGRDAVDAGRLDEALDLLGKAVEANPMDLDAKALYDDTAERFLQHAYGNSMRPDKVPVLVRDFTDLTSERLRPEEGFLLSRINGSWDLKSIIDISPLSEPEALLIMKRLVDRGIVELR